MSDLAQRLRDASVFYAESAEDSDLMVEAAAAIESAEQQVAVLEHECERLRRVIEEAPHSPSCLVSSYQHYVVHGKWYERKPSKDDKCNCWKSAALAQKP